MTANHKGVTLVGTPCQIIAAAKIEHYPETLGESPVDFKLGLFCMENFSHSYLKEFLKQNEIEMGDVDQFRVEKGHFWAYLKNGDVFKTPLSKGYPSRVTVILSKRQSLMICLRSFIVLSQVRSGFPCR